MGGSLKSLIPVQQPKIAGQFYSIKTIYIGGSRCFDVATCLEIKGVDKDKFIVFENYDELASEVSRKSVTGRSIIVFFELYATRVVKKIRAAIKEKGDK